MPTVADTRRYWRTEYLLFSFNSATGTLTPERSLDTYNGTNGGPTTVEFNNDGTKLAVATWGISHFGTETPTHQTAKPRLRLRF